MSRRQPGSPGSPGGVSRSGSQNRMRDDDPPSRPLSRSSSMSDLNSYDPDSKAGEKIRVVVRCRPPNKKETTEKQQIVCEVKENEGAVVVTRPNNKSRRGSNSGRTTSKNVEMRKQFTFDQVYGTRSSQQDIWESLVRPLVDSAVVEGEHGTVFAFGQTGCGKTYTMEGTPDAPGVIPRAIERVFEMIAKKRQEDPSLKVQVTASHVEVYNEEMSDLLNAKAGKLKFENDEIKGMVASEVSSANELLKVLDKGRSNRVTRATHQNADSSRSHSVFIINVSVTEQLGGNNLTRVINGRLNLVDLAGSERHDHANNNVVQFKEATMINLSLSSLAQVIQSLAVGKKHIPYRNSKLTRILKDSLGGRSKTIMIACVGPAEENFEETVTTLRYAYGSKKIKTMAATLKPEDSKDLLIKEYQAELARLRALFQQQGMGSNDSLASPTTQALMGDDSGQREITSANWNAMGDDAGPARDGTLSDSGSVLSDYSYSEFKGEPPRSSSQNSNRSDASPQGSKKTNNIPLAAIAIAEEEQKTGRQSFREREAKKNTQYDDYADQVDEHEAVSYAGSEANPPAYDRDTVSLAESDAVQPVKRSPSTTGAKGKTSAKSTAGGANSGRRSASAERPKKEEKAATGGGFGSRTPRFGDKKDDAKGGHSRSNSRTGTTPRSARSNSRGATESKTPRTSRQAQEAHNKGPRVADTGEIGTQGLLSAMLHGKTAADPRNDHQWLKTARTEATVSPRGTDTRGREPSMAMDLSPDELKDMEKFNQSNIDEKMLVTHVKKGKISASRPFQSPPAKHKAGLPNFMQPTSSTLHKMVDTSNYDLNLRQGNMKRPMRMSKALDESIWKPGFAEIEERYYNPDPNALNDGLNDPNGGYGGQAQPMDGPLDAGDLEIMRRNKEARDKALADMGVGNDNNGYVYGDINDPGLNGGGLSVLPIELGDTLNEFKDLRYTPVFTETPFNFKDEFYTLWCQDMGRPIKIFIVVTMYNEKRSELDITLRGIAHNLQGFEEDLGSEFWKHVCVCIVSDGREKCNKTTLEYAEEMGFFDRGLLEKSPFRNGNNPEYNGYNIDGHDEVKVHLFEHTCRLHEDENYDAYYPPMQVVFALKENNAGKLDSHAWFFNAFAHSLQPEYTYLIDVGTFPRDCSIVDLFYCMEDDDKIGGCCGEIAVRNKSLLNPIIGGQQFEYLISTNMDKAVESVMGYIAVLPGAFSAYRYAAIKSDDGRGPLANYFKSLITPLYDLGPLRANMFLAEDRILCFELVALEKHDYVLHYVSSSVADTDVPDNLIQLIQQRRRWMNGAFFAMLYSLHHYGDLVFRSGHNYYQKGIFCLQWVYMIIQLLTSWFFSANLYLSIHIVLAVVLPGIYYTAIEAVFLCLLFALMIYALGNSVQQTKTVYRFCATCFGVVMIITVGSMVFYLAYNDVSSEVRIAGALTIAMYLLVAGMNGNLWNCVSTVIHYFIMLPTHVLVFSVYSFSNIHDISWGTKSLTNATFGHGAGAGAAALRERTRPDETGLREVEKKAMSRAGSRAGSKAPSRAPSPPKSARGEPLSARGNPHDGPDDIEMASLDVSKLKGADKNAKPDDDNDDARSVMTTKTAETAYSYLPRSEKAAVVSAKADTKQYLGQDIRARLNTPEQIAETEKNFKSFRSSMLYIWLITNIIFVRLVYSYSLQQQYLFYLFVFVVVYNGTRTSMCVFYVLGQWYRRLRRNSLAYYLQSCWLCFCFRTKSRRPRIREQVRRKYMMEYGLAGIHTENSAMEPLSMKNVEYSPMMMNGVVTAEAPLNNKNNLPNCPNASNPYHECSEYCKNQYGGAEKSDEASVLGDKSAAFDGNLNLTSKAGNPHDMA